ncbi:flavodoxin domain-containing protein [Pectobacterium punjabense]|uniref:flavodoxin domain-containing protein n=1 Tax=Pectobacterium punjabense TaxID=2108399 RepID=UPI001969976A|nr:flavodoxin family protein [Pectobacterium punjabense]MBN3137520.1 flavodoxin-like domain-containing protein [Pectobacterium punjabense]MCE5380534.1 flavodoxin-like domain-containing protein [Pectobacterium punjabense]
MLKIIYGTESGNAEMAAEDMAAMLNDSGITATAVSMDAYDVAEMANEEHIILMTSTYGEGELPMTAAPFYASLKDSAPDLQGVKFSAFGLGDSTYETYNQAIRSFITLMQDLGARQVGEPGFHDAALPYAVSDMAVCWASRQFIVAN